MYDISGSAWDFKCTQTAPAPQMLYYDQSALLGGTRGAKHILKCPPSRHAPECRLYTWSIRIKLKLFWKEVGNGILLDHPLPIKLHQSYQPQSTFYSGIESRIARNPVGTCGTAAGMQTSTWDTRSATAPYSMSAHCPRGYQTWIVIKHCTYQDGKCNPHFQQNKGAFRQNVFLYFTGSAAFSYCSL